MSDTPPLYFRDLGDSEKPVLCLMHGLFGSSSNWMGIVRLLQDQFRIINLDLRNHGRSPHYSEMSYPLMVDDLLALCDHLDLQTVSLLGHSMGGKVAMLTALTNPERVEKLLVADIAPVAYEHRFASIFKGLQSMPLAQLESRDAADLHLSDYVAEPGVRQYLLQNLQKRGEQWEWRFNLQSLKDAIPLLTDFPEVAGNTFPGDALFIHGELSDYVNQQVIRHIDDYFPHNRRRMIHAAGHWLYAEQPVPFAQAVASFLK
ncbi:MAG: alpha/beta fold hydrolase [Candidatus Thiodiazotropha taylori]|nr:alpha/beta fold hydrolase [Candidatus Thiodiazotropha taylori]MCG7961116.1 alpha/beta fold hydrolase [Candidatus Thiodiazotropha endolucinida]MCG7925371.1 alpha/beta fold hydrolase [Candidatus Thiodiazotropha taylori]MCG7933313.1 alpha/beta fold hydrolase [Candidatus Thiodiazotropha taylori]MCG7958804.1 alpha/beta fold hydrolase [Candidatus Thiodiazotropha taylori]